MLKQSIACCRSATAAQRRQQIVYQRRRQILSEVARRQSISQRSRTAAIVYSKKSHGGNRPLNGYGIPRCYVCLLMCFLIFVYFLWNFAPIDSKYFVSHHVFLLHEVAVALVSSTYRVDMLVSVRVCMCASALVPRGRARASARV